MQKREYCVIGPIQRANKSGLVIKEGATLDYLNDSGNDIAFTLGRRQTSDELVKIISKLGDDGW